LVNNKFGREEGDRALREVAGLLKWTFGESRLLARFDGDEFAVMVEDSDVRQAEEVVQRFRGALAARNARDDAVMPLAVRVGVSIYDPVHPCSLAALVAQAESTSHAERQPRLDSSRDTLAGTASVGL
jgi:diguanylate cyclase (GGDEF)-like protein